MPSPINYTFQETTFDLSIPLGKAYFLKTEFGINLLNLFEGDNLDAFLQTIALNDEKMIDIWWHYIGEKYSDRETAVDKLSRDDLTKFKEAFWDAVINFSDKNAQSILISVKKQLPELLKRQAENLLKQDPLSQNETTGNES
jgi:hypothetical protein